MASLPHQDRNNFDVQKVLDFIRESDEAPPQGWQSLVQQACIRMFWMESRIAAAKDAADVIATSAKKLRDEAWWSGQ